MVKVIVGGNDFETWCYKNNRTDLLKEWDYVSNKPLLPRMVTHGSNKPIAWKCMVCGHKWTARLANRTKHTNPRGCPKCGKTQSAKSRRKTSLAQSGSVYDWCIENKKMHLLDEWDVEKNYPQTPKTIPWGSAKDYIWWKCPHCGISYQSRLDHRRKGLGHRYCKSSSLHNSDAEVGVLFYFQNVFGDKKVIANYTDDRSGISELDVYIPDLAVAVEYDGEGYHTDMERDLRKDKACLDAGIKLYRIREPGCPVLDSTSICVIRERTAFNSDYDNALKFVFAELGVDADVNSIRDQGEIIKLRGRIVSDNSLQKQFPQIAEEWDYSENYPLTPEMVSYGADRYVGWICKKCGNKFGAYVYQRTNPTRPSGCPACGVERRRKAKSKPVKQYSLDGKFIAEYVSITDAARRFGVSSSNIGASCTKRYTSSGGYIWRYSEDSQPVLPVIKENRQPRFERQIAQYSMDGLFIAEFSTIVNAQLETGVSASNIYRNAAGDRKSAGGYMWSFNREDTVAPYKTDAHNRRPVCQYTMDGEFVDQFESVLYAEKVTGINEATIRDCCSGRCKTAGGYIWRDAVE